MSKNFWQPIRSENVLLSIYILITNNRKKKKKKGCSSSFFQTTQSHLCMWLSCPGISFRETIFLNLPLINSKRLPTNYTFLSLSKKKLDLASDKFPVVYFWPSHAKDKFGNKFSEEGADFRYRRKIAAWWRHRTWSILQQCRATAAQWLANRKRTTANLSNACSRRTELILF